MDAVPGAWSELEGSPLKLFRPRVERDVATTDAIAPEPGTVLAADARHGLQVAAGEGSVVVDEVQPAGKRRMPARDWLRGPGGAARTAAGVIPRLHVVTDDQILARPGFRAAALQVLETGGTRVALHVRGPHTTGRAMYQAAAELILPARRAGAWLVVNDRVDVALALGIRRVHLGARSLPAQVARPTAWTGRLRGPFDPFGCGGPWERRTDRLSFCGNGVRDAVTSGGHPGRDRSGPGGGSRRHGARGGHRGNHARPRVAGDPGRGARSGGDPRGVGRTVTGRWCTAFSELVATGLMTACMDATVNIRLNGKEREIASGTTVSGLLDELRLVAGMVVVEHNREILAPRQLRNGTPARGRPAGTGALRGWGMTRRGRCPPGEPEETGEAT